MSITRGEAEKAAMNQLNKAKGLRSQADRKDGEAKQLEDRAKSAEKGTRLMSLGGPGVRMLGASRKHSAQKLQSQAKEVRREAERLREQAKSAEREAQNWKAKAESAGH